MYLPMFSIILILKDNKDLELVRNLTVQGGYISIFQLKCKNSTDILLQTAQNKEKFDEEQTEYSWLWSCSCLRQRSV